MKKDTQETKQGLIIKAVKLIIKIITFWRKK